MNLSVESIFERILREAEEMAAETEETDEEEQQEVLPAATVDGQIDSFVVNAEKNSIVNESISEADEEETDAETEDTVSTEPPNIDMVVFTEKIARLIENYDNLLDIKSVIVNRVVNFLTENYGVDTVNEFKEFLESVHHVELEPESGEEPPERPLAPGALGSE